MKKLIMIISVMFISTLLFAQTDTIKSEIYFPDRPGFTCNALSVGLHAIDYETSFGYSSNLNESNNKLMYNTNLIRFGVLKNLELRFGMDFGHLSNSVGGIKNMSLGIKVPIIQDLKYLPDIGILGQFNLPKIDDNYFTTPQYTPQGILLLQKGFGKLLLLGNIGFFYDGGYYNDENKPIVDQSIQGIYSLAVCYSLTPKLGTFVECYRVGSYGSYGDLGFNYFINDNLQLDVSFSNQFDGTINGGIAWRFKNK